MRAQRALRFALLVAGLTVCADKTIDAAPPSDAPRVVDAVDEEPLRDVPTTADLADGTQGPEATTADAMDASGSAVDLGASSDASDATELSEISAVSDVFDAPDAPDVLPARDVMEVTDAAPAADLPAVSDARVSCLPTRRADLVAVIASAPYASRSGAARMAVVPRDSAVWLAARRAAMAWAAADCPGFRAAAEAMGYSATELTDAVTGRRHWVLTDTSGRYGGVFVFREPSERAAAPGLVIDSPHWGYDFSDDRAARVYRQTDAVAFLQNTAHRCNLDACSGCDDVSNYACGGCVRVSDVVHSVDQLYFAVYDGLEASRDDLHFEYHGAGASTNAVGCEGTVHLSQGGSRDLSAASDEGTWPNRLWRALEARLGGRCVCYHQRETGCLLSGGASTAGRRTNSESDADAGAINVCTDAPASLSRRFAHMEAYNVSPDDVIAALGVATALP